MTKSSLLIIGREVCKSHPEIAEGIINSQPKPKLILSGKSVNQYFHLFCMYDGLKVEEIKGPVFKSELVERKRVFVGAMYNIFTQVYKFSKIISQTLEQDPATTSRMISDVKFRYRKDEDFKNKVDKFLKKIHYDN